MFSWLNTTLGDSASISKPVAIVISMMATALVWHASTDILGSVLYNLQGQANYIY
jgi:hypothetical protein